MGLPRLVSMHMTHDMTWYLKFHTGGSSWKKYVRLCNTWKVLFTIGSSHIEKEKHHVLQLLIMQHYIPMQCISETHVMPKLCNWFSQRQLAVQEKMCTLQCSAVQCSVTWYTLECKVVLGRSHNKYGFRTWRFGIEQSADRPDIPPLQKPSPPLPNSVLCNNLQRQPPPSTQSCQH